MILKYICFFSFASLRFEIYYFFSHLSLTESILKYPAYFSDLLVRFKAESWSGLSIINVDEISGSVSHVHLTWSVDFDDTLTHHFSPVGNPSDRSGNREDNIEHVFWNMN